MRHHDTSDTSDPGDGTVTDRAPEVLWEAVGDDVILLDTRDEVVYHLTDDLAREAASALAADTSTRRAFMGRLAKGAAAGAVTALALPTAAAAASVSGGGGGGGGGPTPSYLLSVTVADGTYGSVTSNPVGINTPTNTSATYLSGTNVDLTAAPATGGGVLWSGDASGTTLTVTVTMTAAKSVTATFTFPLTVSIAAGGTGTGTVTTDLGAISLSSSGTTTDTKNIAAGSAVQVTGTPDSGSTLAWSGDLTGSTSPQSITMNGTKSVTATFTAIIESSVAPGDGQALVVWTDPQANG